VAEWVYEDGIGENRAALIEGERIIEAYIERHAERLRAGAIVAARLRANRVIEIEGGGEALIDTVPRGMTEGAKLFALITREALPEPRKPKRAKARVVTDAVAAQAAPTLRDRIGEARVITLHDSDVLESAGWSEMIEAAQSGYVPFEGGALQISLTPAMTVIDVDGILDPADLGVAAATAAAAAIRRCGIAGSIGIDFPTTDSKAARNDIAAAFDAALPQPFERTAVNGFGFMQIIRPRARASLCEIMTSDPADHEARALLRRAQRSGVIGNAALVVPPRVERIIAGYPDWLTTLGAQLGGRVTLRVDPSLAIGAGYVEA
jgi:Ribonuclease E/G family